jgi:hypothetical protein
MEPVLPRQDGGYNSDPCASADVTGQVADPVARLAFSLAIAEKAAVLIGTKRERSRCSARCAVGSGRAEVDLRVEAGHLKKDERGHGETKRHQPAWFKAG